MVQTIGGFRSDSNPVVATRFLIAGPGVEGLVQWICATRLKA